MSAIIACSSTPGDPTGQPICPIGGATSNPAPQEGMGLPGMAGQMNQAVDGGSVIVRVQRPSGLSEIGKAIGAVQAAVKNLVAFVKKNKTAIEVSMVATALTSGLQAAAKYGVNAVTNAVTSVANAAPAAEQGVVDNLNAQSPGLGTAAQDVVNTVGSESASAYNSTITDISQIMDENGNINWGVILNDLGPFGG